jgi:uncharacterized protein YjbI with pentapeptide repeats
MLDPLLRYGVVALLPDPHHVEILRRGPRAWNAWREQNPSALPRLMELTLSLSERQLGPISGGPIDLTSARLRNAFLRFATLSEADLAGADLSQADLVHARLDQANLTAANLCGAVLDHADFAGAKLAKANLSGASLNDAQNLTQAQLGESIGNSLTLLPPHLKVPESWINRRTLPPADSARTFSNKRVSHVMFLARSSTELFDERFLKAAALVGGIVLMLGGLIWQFDTHRLPYQGDEGRVRSTASAELRGAPPAESRDAKSRVAGPDAPLPRVLRSNRLTEIFARMPQPNPVIVLPLPTLLAKPPQYLLSLQEKDAPLAGPADVSNSVQEIPLVEDPPGMVTVTEIAGLDPQTSFRAVLPSAVTGAKPLADGPVTTAALPPADTAKETLRDMSASLKPDRKPRMPNVDVVPKPARKPFISNDGVGPAPARKPDIQKNLAKPKVARSAEPQGAPRTRQKLQSFETMPNPTASRGSTADVLAGGL